MLEVLAGLGLKEMETADNYIEVLNKTDLLNTEEQNILYQKLANHSQRQIPISAVTGAGCTRLLTVIDKIITKNNKICTLRVQAEDGKIQSWLYQNTEVINKEISDEQFVFTIKIDITAAQRLDKLFHIKTI